MRTFRLITLFCICLSSHLLASFSGNNQAGHNLFSKLCKKEKNLLISPISTYYALSLAYLGSNNSTYDAFQDVLCTNLSHQEHAGFLSDYLARISSHDDGYTFEITNSIWLDYAFEVTPYYKQMTDGLGEFAYFSRWKGNEAVATINKWVKDATHDLIPSLLCDGSIDESTSSVLVNTVYFNGAWVTPFSEKRTKKATFFTLSNEVETDFMNQETRAEYKTLEEFDILRLPFERSFGQHRLACVIVLPHQKDQDPVELFTDKNIPLVFGSMHRENVNITLPKFSHRCSLDLTESLEEIGLHEALSPNADFSNLSKEQCYISQVVHEAVFDMHEKGLEAAAATACTMCLSTAMPEPLLPPLEFRADHPFIYMLIDQDEEAILFMGVYRTPES